VTGSAQDSVNMLTRQRAYRRRWIPYVIVLALLATTAEARLYRWVDEQGNVHYTDTLPPGQLERGHAEMSDKGLVVDTTEPAKTPEELQQEQELKRLRDAVERAKQKQEAADRALLQSFRTVDDMMMARDGQIASIDATIRVTRSNIRRQQDVLRGLRTDAANLERTGKPIPGHLNSKIGNTEKAIRDAYGTILDRERQKQEIYARFAGDLKRYRQLKDIPEGTDAKQDEEDKAASALIQNLVPCADAETCDRLWERASAYVRQQTSTPIQTSGPNILIADPPAGQNDIGLTLARIQDKQGSGASLFLDAQCIPSLRGDTTCTSPQARHIIEGFHDAVLGQGKGD